MVITTSPADHLPSSLVQVSLQLLGAHVPAKSGLSYLESPNPGRQYVGRSRINPEALVEDKPATRSPWARISPEARVEDEPAARSRQEGIRPEGRVQDDPATRSSEPLAVVVRRFFRRFRPEGRVQDEPAGRISEPVAAAVGSFVQVSTEAKIRPEARVEAVLEIGATSEPPQAQGTDQMELEDMTWKKAADDFATDFDRREKKIHKLPPGLQSLASRYIVPIVVAIGPYHHHLYHLQQMEKVKQVAAHHFVRDSGHSSGEMYAAVLSVADDARSLYADEAVAGMDGSEFAAMMLRDGCFLLQYMLTCTTDHNMPPSLLSCFKSNQAWTSNDIMLLENQIPWVVLETLRRFRPVLVEEFVAKMGRTLQARGDVERKPFVLDGSYSPPHLLGLLRFYKTGGIVSGLTPSAMSKTISAIELKEIGITLTASKTTKFVDMGIKEGLLSTNFFLAPLLLDEIRSCWLVNMVAFELCTLTGTDICSYLAVLAMLMDREEDVHELRSKRLVQGELTNKETLDFFKMLVKHISGGPLYTKILEEIEAYKLKRRVWIKVHEFVYKNFKAIVAVLSVVGVLIGVFRTLASLHKH